MAESFVALPAGILAQPEVRGVGGRAARHGGQCLEPEGWQQTRRGQDIRQGKQGRTNSPPEKAGTGHLMGF